MVDLQCARLGSVNARVVSILDEEYPANLKRIYDPPPFVFVRGSLDDRDAVSIAIVGTRSPTPYGIEMAGRFAAEFVAAGIPVVSGLARGIDTVAHRRALESDGRTLAVIGSGVDVIYPPENFRLAERIVAHGAVLSEFAMGAKPDAGNFPRRNRIISGIALATLVVETAVDGGAMITAGTALDQDRDVFAVPGPVRAGVRSGTHLLIKQGNALLVESVQEVLDDLAPRLREFVPATSLPPPRPAPALSLFERQLYDVLGQTPIHIDQIAGCAGCTSADALVHLLSLEFKGVVRQIPGKMFARI
jgi:DNA processing protein